MRVRFPPFVPYKYMPIDINLPPINLSNYNKSLKWKEQMSDQEIIELFDYSTITLKELSDITGKSVEELKALLIT